MTTYISLLGLCQKHRAYLKGLFMCLIPIKNIFVINKLLLEVVIDGFFSTSN